MAGLLSPSGAQAPQDPQAGAMPASAQQAPEAAGQPPAQGGTEISDPILKQIEEQYDQAVPQEQRNDYQSALVAGMTVMFSKETSSMMIDQLKASDDIVKNVADGVAGLIVLVYNEAKLSEEQIPGLVAAAVPLMCQALDYWEKTGGGQVTEELAAQATKATLMATLAKFGISEEQVNQVAQAGLQSQQGAGAAAPPQGA